MPGILDLSELFSTMTRDMVMSTMLEVAEDVGLKITAWQPGQPGRSILVLTSQRIADFTRTTSEAIKGGFLDSAEEGWLTLLARYLYRVDRVAARFATGDSLEITNADDRSYGPFPPGDFIIAHAVTGKTYRNVAELTIPIGVTSDVEIIADEAGTGSDAAPGTITEVVSSLVGVTVTNVAAVLGAEEESDPELRTRCRDKLGSLSPDGPKEAYAYVIKTPALCPTVVPITRVRPSADIDTGEISLYVATDAGAPTAPDVVIAQASVDRWAEPFCVLATVIGATDLVVPVTCHVWIKDSSATEAEIQNAIATRLAEYFKTIPIGGEVIPPATDGRLDVDALKAQLFQATVGVVDATIAAPAADVTMLVNEVAQLGAVTTTVTVIS